MAVLMGALGWVVRGIHVPLRAPLADATHGGRCRGTIRSTKLEPLGEGK